jgi:hypothetical protein
MYFTTPPVSSRRTITRSPISNRSILCSNANTRFRVKTPNIKQVKVSEFAKRNTKRKHHHKKNKKKVALHLYSSLMHACIVAAASYAACKETQHKNKQKQKKIIS